MTTTPWGIGERKEWPDERSEYRRQSGAKPFTLRYAMGHSRHRHRGIKGSSLHCHYAMRWIQSSLSSHLFEPSVHVDEQARSLILVQSPHPSLNVWLASYNSSLRPCLCSAPPHHHPFHHHHLSIPAQKPHFRPARISNSQPYCIDCGRSFPDIPSCMTPLCDS